MLVRLLHRLALKEMILSAMHETGQYQNNRVENSHQQIRQQTRPLLFAGSYRTLRNIGFEEFNKVSGWGPCQLSQGDYLSNLRGDIKLSFG
jgi:transposase-like protein